VASRAAICIVLLALTVGCGDADFSVLTYNVAGLPQALSGVSPEQNTSQMSSRLNEFDVVLAQENFAYHEALAADANHPHQFPLNADSDIKSGLSRFSQFAMARHHGERWEQCNGLSDQGSDCATHKGFSVAEHTIEMDGRLLKIDFYNLHMDSGDTPDDRSTRSAQVTQLLAAIERRSARKAIIIAGDTNISEGDDISLRRLLDEGGFSDACRELGCAEPERIDRILYRSTEWVELEPSDWRLADGFVDDQNKPLSDHEPVAVDFSVTVHPPIPADAGGSDTGDETQTAPAASR
jgi:endonuclease/exonuclease/phosphatase family metal-dependent hydrolase